MSLKHFHWLNVNHGLNSSYNVFYDFGKPIWHGKLHIRKSLNLDITNSRISSYCQQYGNHYLTNLPVEDIVLFVGQSYKHCLELDVDVINWVRKNFPNRTIVYKMHPNKVESSEGNSKNKFLKFLYANTIVVTSKFPVEIYISKLINCSVLSAYSTSCVFYNPSCIYAWYYPLRKSATTYNGRLEFSLPANHIKLINNMDDLKKVML